jgi:hypothetical protein
LKEEKFTLDKNVEGKIRDVSFRADRIDLDNAARSAVISGNIVAHREDGTHFTAKNIAISYKEGAHKMSVDGHVIMKLPGNTKKMPGAEGTGTPGGGSP